MTHNERIEAVARAIHYISDRTLPYETEHKHWDLIAEAALAAAGVEEIIREAIGAYRGMLNDALSVDLENGVKWLSQRAAVSFWRDYPELCRALEADSEDNIVREVIGK
jgi:hypothetical protein